MQDKSELVIVVKLILCYKQIKVMSQRVGCIPGSCVREIGLICEAPQHTVSEMQPSI